MKKVVGLLTKVKVIGRNTVVTVGKFDTGAKRTSLDYDIALEAGLKFTNKNKIYMNSVGKHRRRLANATLIISGKKFDVTVNISNRKHSIAKVLIGRDIILNNFVIDISKTNYGPSEKQVIRELIV